MNMAARLMSKADNGILIDDATYDRLPGNVLQWLEALSPMKVKGRDEPLQVYKYIARELTISTSIHEESVEDHEINPSCKAALLSLLHRMELRTPSANYISRPSQLMRATSSLIQSQPKLPVVILSGKLGAGKTTSIMWLRRQAQYKAISMITMRLTKKDSLTDFSVWKRLFPMLMPKDLFLNLRTQEKYIRVLLKQAYSDDSAKAINIAMPVLQSILGITCKLTTMNTTTNNNSTKGGGNEFSSRSNRSVRMYFTSANKAYTGPPVPVNDTLVTIFSHLLTTETVLIAIQDIELADELSLKVLIDLINISSKSALVLTALSSPETDNKLALINRFFQSKSLNIDAFQCTSWEKQYKDIILKHKYTTLVTLENFTNDEMDRMLCSVLGVRTVPEELAALVHDFSGGSYFWIREIVNFIKEHGSEQFMAAVGESSTTEAETEEDNAMGSPQGRPSPAPLTRGMSNASLLTRPNAPPTLSRSNSIMRPLARGQSFKTLITTRQKTSQFQLKMNKLILCRFEGMHSDVQRILRTAAIIGMIFSDHVLYGVLPVHLKPEMATCMKWMLNLKWLYKDTDDPTLYQFVHTHAHQVIYELTPTSERKNIHRLIAEYIEETSGDDKSQYALLSYHYQHYDPEKALRYAVEATNILLNTSLLYDYSDCIDLLLGSFDCCQTSYDIDILKKLVCNAINIIRKFDPTAKEQPQSLWYNILNSCSLCRGNTAVVHPIQTKTNDNKYKLKNDMRSPSRLGSLDSEDDEEIDLTTLSYEMRLKYDFLEQLNKLGEKLKERGEQINNSNNHHLDEAKDWQRSILNLSAKEKPKFSMLRGLGKSSDNADMKRFISRSNDQDGPSGRSIGNEKLRIIT